MRGTKANVVGMVLMLTTLIAVNATAIEVKLRDGTVLEAESYKMTGSYVMLTLTNGRKVAYAVADVDVDHLKEQERAAKQAAIEQPAEKPKTGLGTAFGAAALDSASTGESTFALTDEDVGHVRRKPEGEGEEEEPEEDPAASSGRVSMEGLTVEALDESGRYQVRGRVVNGTKVAVRNVRVTVTVDGSDNEISVAGSLGAGQEANFQHSFAPKNPDAPDVNTTLRFIQPETPSSSGKSGKSDKSDAEAEAEAVPEG